MSKYSIFGAGPSGLYTAWRLVKSGKLTSTDSLHIYDWGQYDFNDIKRGRRAPAGRICTYHYQNDPESSYIEVGGMRFKKWDGGENSDGQRIITRVIDDLKLSDDIIDFKTTEDPLFYLRTQNIYESEIEPSDRTNYFTERFNEGSPDDVYNDLATNVLNCSRPKTRIEQLKYYQEGMLKGATGSAYSGGIPVRNVGYWNSMYDNFGEEAYQYADDGGGYTSNVINWNTADAVIYNGEFAPGGSFKTLSKGMSSIFQSLFNEIREMCLDKKIPFEYCPGHRLQSIAYDKEKKVINFKIENRKSILKISETETTNYAFLGMPRESLEIVADGTKYTPPESNIVNVLNTGKVPLYIESVIKQPSYKIAMFFETEWWKVADYSPNLYDDNGKQIAFGPTITDLPIRQVYYFGDNGSPQAKKRYGILASYDDMQYIYFWRELEKNGGLTREVPLSEDTQPLTGAVNMPSDMVNMIRKQLAKIHYGPDADLTVIPEPEEAVFMDWSLKPFGAGYHAWAPSYDINDVMDKIRKPTQLIEGDVDANIFIMGSAYSNDQAWIEGAFCTAESILVDYLKIDPIISQEYYPFVGRSAGMLNGPVGGYGGTFFNDATTEHSELIEISVSRKNNGSSQIIEGIKFTYRNGEPTSYGTFNTPGSTTSDANIEYAIAMLKVYYDPKISSGKVVGIEIFAEGVDSGLKSIFHVGDLSAVHCTEFKTPKDMLLTAFCGRSNIDIDALGAVYNIKPY